MGRKTRFVAFDWTTSSPNVPNTQLPNATANKKQVSSIEAQPTLTGWSPSEHLTNSYIQYVNNTEEAQSEGCAPSTKAPDITIVDKLPPQRLNTMPLPNSFNQFSSFEVSVKAPLPLVDNQPFIAAERAHDSFSKLSLASNRSGYDPEPVNASYSSYRGLSEAAPAPQYTRGCPTMSSLSGPPSLMPSPRNSISMARSASSPALATRPSHLNRLWPRKPVQFVPRPGKVYFVPDGRYFPDSIIHNQKNQVGFFRHPILVIDVEGVFVNFYAMTKEPPSAIRELNMALRLGIDDRDLGPDVLSLASGSNIMLQETWINLEQRFFIEWKNLDDWAVDVQVDLEDLNKIHHRVAELEAEQNRYIYKPLLRAMSTMQPGTIIMLTNTPGSATFGAPILIVENNYPEFHFLRVKRFEDNFNFNPEARRHKGSSRQMSLAITKHPQIGHDGTPVMILEPDSPNMREESYVEIHGRPQSGMLDRCKTWCWPPVRINQMSMVILRNYMADTVARVASYSQALPQPQMSAYHTGAMVHPPVAPAHAGYYQPHQGPQWQAHRAMQQPGYHAYPPMLTPAYPPSNYMYGSSSIFQPRTGPGSGQNRM